MNTRLAAARTMLRVAESLFIAAKLKGSPKSFDVLLKTLAKLLRDRTDTRTQAAKLTSSTLSKLYHEERKALASLWHSVENLATKREGKISKLGKEPLDNSVRDKAKRFFSEVTAVVDEGDGPTKSLLSAFERIAPTLIKQTYDALHKDRPRTTKKTKSWYPPKDFNTFRKMLARAVKYYDPMLAHDIADVDYEGPIAYTLRSHVWEQYEAVTHGKKTRDRSRMEDFLVNVKENLPAALESIITSHRDPKNHVPTSSPSHSLRHSHVSMLLEDFTSSFKELSVRERKNPRSA